MARRDDREYREYLREEQRRQPGCPAREVVLDQRGQATSPEGPVRAASRRRALRETSRASSRSAPACPPRTATRNCTRRPIRRARPRLPSRITRNMTSATVGGAPAAFRQQTLDERVVASGLVAPISPSRDATYGAAPHPPAHGKTMGQDARRVAQLQRMPDRVTVLENHSGRGLPAGRPPGGKLGADPRLDDAASSVSSNASRACASSISRPW